MNNQYKTFYIVHGTHCNPMDMEVLIGGTNKKQAVRLWGDWNGGQTRLTNNFKVTKCKVRMEMA